MNKTIELLGRIQKELKAPKNQFNSFGKYKYRSCEDILEALKPLLIEGASITITDDIVMIGERYYVKATASLHFEETIFCTAYAREPESKKGMDESQITGAASSYARKYALNGLLLIDDTKDADVTNKHGQNGSQDAAESPTADDKPKVNTQATPQKTPSETLNKMMLDKGLKKAERKAFFDYSAQGQTIDRDFYLSFIQNFDTLFAAWRGIK